MIGMIFNTCLQVLLFVIVVLSSIIAGTLIITIGWSIIDYLIHRG